LYLQNLSNQAFNRRQQIWLKQRLEIADTHNWHRKLSLAGVKWRLTDAPIDEIRLLLPVQS
jgi:hypothetical protein